MSNRTILLTGATGLVGFPILERAIDAGYCVRLAVRSEAKAADLRSALAASGRSATETEYTIVTDMTKEGAFDDAVNGVQYVIHVASPIPIPSEDLDATIIKPAVAVTIGLLNSVLHSSSRSVEKVVITSSVYAVMPTEPRPFDADNVELDPMGPWTHELQAYAASKKLAYNATRRFVAEQKPYFEVINILPTLVIGRNHFAQSRQDYTTGSNPIALAPLLGVEIPFPILGAANHVDDVAAVHIAVLTSSAAGHRSYGVNYDGRNGVEWNSAIDIVKCRMPDSVSEDGFPLGGSVPTERLRFDASKTERELGINFKDFEAMVVDLARGYLDAKP